MIYTSLFTSLLLATAAFAAPGSRRESQGQRTRPLQRLSSEGDVASNVSLETFSSNWAGAVWNKPAGTFKAVTSTFTVPTPRGEGSASAWVGIDGDTCKSAILQTGISFNVKNGVVSYDAWYEWFPDYAHNFHGIPISAGDVIRLTVTASSSTSGEAVVENLTKHKTVSKSITSSAPLCGQDAEWIVEDFEENGSLVEFTNFGKVAFSNAFATTSVSKITPSEADVLNIRQNGRVLTASSESAYGVTVRHT